jgi:hypothetical protein
MKDPMEWYRKREERERDMVFASILWRITTGTIIDPDTLRILFEASEEAKNFQD